MNDLDYRSEVNVSGKTILFFDIRKLNGTENINIDKLPFSIRILVENLLRNENGDTVKQEDVVRIATWKPHYDTPSDIPYYPARVLMQDFTGVPAVVDLASMRHALKESGGDPAVINPLIPVELIVDHSVQVDFFGTDTAHVKNVEMEYQRNGERYELLKWAQESFNNFSVVPPNSGICHQVNLEYLSRVMISEEKDGEMIAYPDTLVGTDSHTTMINGIGVMGWGVGGIEAEAVMLGQPYYMAIPEVVGFRLSGELKENVTATDLVLTITSILRKQNVVEKFVEFTGRGMASLSIADRATIANMSPEYGATMGFFPIDEKTIDYLKLTGRDDRAEMVQAVATQMGLFCTGKESIEYSTVIELDLSTVEPSLAGPKRPQDRISVANVKNQFIKSMESDKKSPSTKKGLKENKFTPAFDRMAHFGLKTDQVKIRDGSIVIAAITSCTNTSNPDALIGAGLLARNAVEKGLKISPYIKTSFAPGSRVVDMYLESADLLSGLKALGFHTAGFGCTTCIGNSGPLQTDIEKAISENNLVVAAVLSGNRNFEARIHQKVRANFLMSPILVVAFALSGKIDIDFEKEPLGMDPNGTPVFLKDIWPSKDDIRKLVSKHVKPLFYGKVYKTIFKGDDHWKKLAAPTGVAYEWNSESTYIKNPPYFDSFNLNIDPISDIENARVLLLLGDSVTTDHISPAGEIPQEYPAGKYLMGRHVQPEQFNSYGSRRGNDEVMIRGTFGNVRIKNKLVSPKEGSFTLKFPEKKEMYVYDAAVLYEKEDVPLIVIGGKEYGTGSSRDWAAKGTRLLGVKAVIAESFERIHRSNLVGMGVLPLVFKSGENLKTLGLDGSECYDIVEIYHLKPGSYLSVKAIKDNGETVPFQVIVKLNSDMELQYYIHGGILPFVLRKIIREQ
ncbi:MAG: aconitate hydratase AcnA [Proteobacteria bacterium]|nr:aconitate hydratase AcnA [Pseudomonadota bacterium]